MSYEELYVGVVASRCEAGAEWLLARGWMFLEWYGCSKIFRSPSGKYKMRFYPRIEVDGVMVGGWAFADRLGFENDGSNLWLESPEACIESAARRCDYRSEVWESWGRFFRGMLTAPEGRDDRGVER